MEARRRWRRPARRICTWRDGRKTDALQGSGNRDVHFCGLRHSRDAESSACYSEARTGVETMTSIPDFAKVDFAAAAVTAPGGAHHPGSRRRHRGEARSTRQTTSRASTSSTPIPASRRYLRAPIRDVRDPALDHPEYAGFSTRKDSNAFYRRNLAAGQKGLSIPSISPPPRATTAIIRALRRCRQWPCGYRFHLRHADAVLRHPARPDDRCR